MTPVVRNHVCDRKGPPAICLLDTGARCSEISKLKWSQINLKEETINLHRTKADVEKYFSELGFSVLKAESDRLTTGQRAAFIRNVFEDVK